MRIGDCCRINAQSYSNREQWKTIRYLDTGSITEGKVTEIQTFITGTDKIPSRAKRKVKSGDILFSTVRPNQKHYGIVSNDTKNLLVSTGFAVITVDTTIADPYFIYYYLTQNEIIESLQSIAEQSTSTYPSIKPSDIEDIEINLPKLDIQKNISMVLRSLDDKIKLNQRINDNLERQAIALYDHFVTGSDWPIVAISDIAQKIAMGPFGSNIKVSTFVSEGVPIISGNHLRGYFLEEPEFNFITKEHAERLKNSVVYPHDLIFTHAGNIGQVAMIPESSKFDYYVLSQRQFYLRCDETKVVPEFLLLFFHSTVGQHELLSYANQTGVPSISQPASNLRKIQFRCPPISEQTLWKEQIKPLIGRYLNNRHEIECLCTLRDTLLPRLMSGELDVSGLNL